jgi:predicted glycosyltransferase
MMQGVVARAVGGALFVLSDKPKLIFYCHVLFGLGHLMRTLRIAEAVLRLGNCDCTLITSCKGLDRIPRDPRLKIVALPPVRVSDSGHFYAEAESDSEDVMKVRSQCILEYLASHRPDLVLIDHVPFGLGNELVATLLEAQHQNWRTQFVWGIPYIDEELRPLKSRRYRTALSTYGSTLAYSDPKWLEIFPHYERFGLPEIQEYVGIVSQSPLPPLQTDDTVVVGVTGSGVGGRRLLSLMLEARDRLPASRRIRLRFVAGLLGHEPQLREMLTERPDVELLADAPIEEVIRDASLVVSRAGYNSAYTLAQTDLPTILVPLTERHAYREQSERTRLLAELPAIWHLEENASDVVREMATLMEQGLDQGKVTRTLPFRTDGAQVAALRLLQRAQAS